ncbi:MAG: hypothetical protein J3K34DRAFT_501431 [Monoraphidium minutum]|nr:MAG: hypothetical protein J3K34DRAFT_501431 [Monoraphidium minutum]
MAGGSSGAAVRRRPPRHHCSLLLVIALFIMVANQVAEWRQAYKAMDASGRVGVILRSAGEMSSMNADGNYILHVATSPDVYSSIDPDITGGKVFVPAPPDQRPCSTCVAHALITAAEAAVATMTDIDVRSQQIERMSVQDLFWCSDRYHECDSGWTLKDALEVIKGRCLPYKAEPRGFKTDLELCKVERQCDNFSKIPNRGKFDFKAIRTLWAAQRHIRNWGTVVTRFDIYSDFGDFLKEERNKGKIYKPSPGAKLAELAQPGDFLGRIAWRFSVPLQRLLRDNVEHIEDPGAPIEGKTILVCGKKQTRQACTPAPEQVPTAPPYDDYEYAYDYDYEPEPLPPPPSKVDPVYSGRYTPPISNVAPRSVPNPAAARGTSDAPPLIQTLNLNGVAPSFEDVINRPQDMPPGYWVVMGAVKSELLAATGIHGSCLIPAAPAAPRHRRTSEHDLLEYLPFFAARHPRKEAGVTGKLALGTFVRACWIPAGADILI